jgi:hypothetical protein
MIKNRELLTKLIANALLRCIALRPKGTTAH